MLCAAAEALESVQIPHRALDGAIDTAHASHDAVGRARSGQRRTP